MNGAMITTVQARGQITLPKKVRDRHGMIPGAVVRVIDEPNGIRMRPVTEGFLIPPKYTRQEYKKVIARITAYMHKHGPLWTEEDDRKREESLKKEQQRWRKLNW